MFRKYYNPCREWRISKWFIWGWKNGRTRTRPAVFAGVFLSKNELTGKKILVTAGPTFEAIDPVRFIGNHSSGKMGVAIAEEFASRDADVTLILGPSNIEVSKNIETVKVTSAQANV
ncbi:MAG: phosphopantothenoylcysteine decarboxylase [Chitinophagaceae bacterium]